MYTYTCTHSPSKPHTTEPLWHYTTNPHQTHKSLEALSSCSSKPIRDAWKVPRKGVASVRS